MRSFRRQISFLAYCLLLLFVALPLSAEDSSLEQLAERALSAREKMMQHNATAADVYAFLALCTENLIYEDPVVNVRMEDKKQIREAMLHFLGRTGDVKIVITQHLAVANVVVFEQQVSFQDNQNAGKTTARRQITLLEFEAQKVRRIADYWAR
jgi:predicted transposase YbfD/YdcC